MNLYLNELAPWERKNEYYRHIQLGQDVKEQTTTINRQTEAFIATQLVSTNAIIASQERVREGIDRVAYGVGRVEQGIYELKSAFEWGISEVVWQIEQNREVLKGILELLMAPLDTQAKERRKRAENAYSNGWIDDAEGEFIESEKLNKYDFAIHISLGMIYLFQKIDKDKALEYFEKAIKYSRPESKYHTSYALLYKALVKRDLALLEEAERCTAEAVELSPNFAEALYQNAQYNAQLRNIQKSMNGLDKAVRLDRNYSVKADNDLMFDPIRSDVNKLFEALRDEVIKSCDEAYNGFRRSIDTINQIVDSTRDADFINFDIKDFRPPVAKIKTFIERNSYLDGLDAQTKLVDMVAQGKDYLGSSKKYLTNIISDIDSRSANTSKMLREKSMKRKDTLVATLTGIGGIISLIVGLESCMARMSSINPRGFGDFFLFLSPFILGIGIMLAGGLITYFVGNAIGASLFSGGSVLNEVEELNRKKLGFERALGKLQRVSLQDVRP